MTHRDGSSTYVPTEGSYIPRKERDPISKLPAPTMELFIEEYKNIKKEHREYLARPLKYWNGVCTSLRTSRTPVNLSWLFPTYSFLFSRRFDYSLDDFSCDCGDHYSMYGEDYSDYGYEYDYEYDYDYGDDSDMVREEYKKYGLDFGDEEEDYSDDDRDSEDSESEEYKPIIKQEDDKTTVRMTNGAHPSAVEEVKVDVKQEIKEETRDGLVTEIPADPMLEKGATSTSSIPDTAPKPAATGSGTGEQTSRNSGIGPDVQTEGKRVSDFRSPSGWNS